jgi:hypothetical protein
MRSDLVQIISNWETIRQGDGGQDNHEESAVDMVTPASFLSGEEQPSYGGLRNPPPQSIDTRAAFLNGSPSYLLYFWELADTSQLIASVLK